MMKRKRIILSAGGTGGHLFPAQETAKNLMKDHDLLFVGASLSKNPYFQKDSFPFKEIKAATLSRNPFKMVKQIGLICKGLQESHAIIKEFDPHLVIGFGSYFTFPLLLGALQKKIPIILHEQNALPGRVNKLFSRYAKGCAITFPLTQKYLKGELVEFPLLKKAPTDDPWGYFGLDPSKKTLLVFGGSQGARGLNLLLLQAAEKFDNSLQILHFTGDKAISERASSLYKDFHLNHCVKEFEENMANAYAVADLAVARAGAATIAELIAYKIPSLLIPFPHAKDNHQWYNAKYFEDEVRGGITCLQKDLNLQRLKEIVDLLLQEKDFYKRNIEAFKNNRALQTFPQYIEEYLRRVE